MKRVVLLLMVTMVLVLLPVAATARTVYQEVIPLTNGLVPEGITEGKGHTFFYGTLNGGAIFQGDYRTGEIEMLVPPDPNRVAVGLSYDKRSNLLYAGSAFGGVAYVYDVADGTNVATIQLTTPFAGFINEATVSQDAVYFTDSFQAQFYRVPLGPGGSLPDPVQVETIPLGGDFVLIPQSPPDLTINANGIVPSANGEWLLMVHSALGVLYRVDPHTGYATEIDLGGANVDFGDGLVLRGHTLYVVQNFLNQIAVIQLDPGLTSGTYVEALTSSEFRVPTTAAIFGNALYAVNARFDEIDPFNAPPDAEFEAVRVEINQ